MTESLVWQLALGPGWSLKTTDDPVTWSTWLQLVHVDGRHETLVLTRQELEDDRTQCQAKVLTWMRKVASDDMAQLLFPEDDPLAALEASLKKLDAVMGKGKPEPTATVWVARNKEGVLERMPVATMTDQHLVRWVKDFRQKFRAQVGADWTDYQVDAVIRVEMVTASAIYQEVVKRGLWAVLAPEPVVSPKPPVTPTPEPKRGQRRIDLEDDP